MPQTMSDLLPQIRKACANLYESQQHVPRIVRDGALVSVVDGSAISCRVLTASGPVEFARIYPAGSQ